MCILSLISLSHPSVPPSVATPQSHPLLLLSLCAIKLPLILIYFSKEDVALLYSNIKTLSKASSAY